MNADERGWCGAVFGIVPLFSWLSRWNSEECAGREGLTAYGGFVAGLPRWRRQRRDEPPRSKGAKKRAERILSSLFLCFLAVNPLIISVVPVTRRVPRQASPNAATAYIYGPRTTALKIVFSSSLGVAQRQEGLTTDSPQAQNEPNSAPLSTATD